MTAVNSSKASLKGLKVTVTTTAQEVTDLVQDAAAAGGTGNVTKGISIKNPTGSGQNLFLGGSDVTNTGAKTGYIIMPGETQSVDLYDETCWVIASASVDVYILWSQKS